MAETLAGTVPEAARPAPEFPMPRATDGCPFAPSPALAVLRDVKPVTKVRMWDESTPWLVTRHADQRALLADPRVSNDEHFGGFPHVSAHREEISKSIPRMIINTDVPEHTRLRRMVTGSFLGRRIEAMRAPVQKIVDRLIDDLLAGPNPADLHTAFALPVPALVLSELLGVPCRDHEFFRCNSDRALDRDAPPEESRAASRALSAYLDHLIGEKLTHPAEDTLSELAGRVDAGDMTRSEAVRLAAALLVAGHETTAAMIGLGTLALLEHPQQLAVLRDTSDPEVVADAVEELLRYLTVVHSGLRRVAKQDIEIGGRTIRAGDGILLELSAANRDPEIFPDADRLDLSRPARRHHAFGHGPHQCLGQSLARLELQVVHGTLHRRVPTLRLAAPIDRLEFDHSGTAYGVRCLPVTW